MNMNGMSSNEGALWDLHMSVVAAKGFRRSWLELDAYLLNILRVCDAEGEHGSKVQNPGAQPCGDCSLLEKHWLAIVLSIDCLGICT